jgi:pimeloyl-ACP methyl ester carboxylesterase
MRGWRDTLYALNEAGFDVLAYDRRGEGLSGGFSDTNTLEQSEDIFRVLDQMESGRGMRMLTPGGQVLEGAAAGGKLMAHVGDLHAPDLASFTTLLFDAFEKQVTVALPGGDRLTIWKRKQPAASGSATGYGVLDVRLELVDMEAPDWANPPKDPPKPFEPVIGGRTVKPTMSREAMRKAFEERLPDGFVHESGD